jgi:hypothetical protein
MPVISHIFPYNSDFVLGEFREIKQVRINNEAAEISAKDGQKNT